MQVFVTDHITHIHSTHSREVLFSNYMYRTQENKFSPQSIIFKGKLFMTICMVY